MAFLIVALLLGASPWDPAAWQMPPARLTSVLFEDGSLTFAWTPRASGAVRARAGARPVEVLLHFSGLDGHRPALPEATGAVAGLSWAEQQPDSSDEATLVVELRAATGFTLVQSTRGAELVAGGGPRSKTRPRSVGTASAWRALGAEQQRLIHDALTVARQGRPGLALTRLAAARETDDAMRVPIARAEARILAASGLSLLSLDPLLVVIEHGMPLERSEAVEQLLDILGRHAGAGVLLAGSLLELADGHDPRLDLEAGRLMLSSRQADAAARYLLRAAVSGALRDRARFMAHAAARLAGEPDAALAHLEALLASARLDPQVRLEARRARARLDYEAGRFAEARRRYAGILADFPGDRAARTESAWIDMRADQPATVITGSLPFDIERDGVDRALLLGAAYLRLCRTRRAAAIATRIIESTQRSSLDVQLDLESARLDLPQLKRARPRYQSVIEMFRERLERHRPLVYASRIQRQAHRLRFSADMRLIDEVRDRRYGRERRSEEHSGFGWRKSTWYDDASPTDRCPSGQLLEGSDSRG